MATDVIELLDDVEAAIERGRIADLRTLVDELVTAYDRSEPSERSRTARARAIARRSMGASPPELVDYLDRSGAVQLARASAATSLGTFAVNPGVAPGDDLVEVVRELRTYEQAFEAATRGAAEVLDSVALPPTVNVLTAELPPEPIPLGTTFTVETIVGNVGDEPADGVTVVVESTDGDHGRSTASIGRLDAGARTGCSVSFDTAEAGDLSLTLEARSDDAQSDRYTIIGEVMDRAGFVDRTGQRLDDLQRELEAADLHRGRETSLARKLDAAARKLVDAEEHATDGRTAAADDAIAAASSVMRAFLDSVVGKRGRGRGGGGKWGHRGDSKGRRRSRGDERARRGRGGGAKQRGGRRGDAEGRRGHSVDGKPRTGQLDEALRVSLAAGAEDVIDLLDAAREVDSGVA